MIIEYLRAKGADPSAHVQRKLTRELLEGVDLAVAMGFDHRDFIRQHFGLEIPLFNQVCFEKEEPVLDLHEVMPDWQSNMDQARAYVQSVVDHIWGATPALLARLPHYKVTG